MTKGNASVAIRNTAQGLIAELRGEIDHHSARILREKIDRALYEYTPRVLTLRMQHVTFMDSAGLGLILGRVTTAESLNCTVQLADMSDRVRKILTLAGVCRINNLVVL